MTNFTISTVVTTTQTLTSETGVILPGGALVTTTSAINGSGSSNIYIFGSLISTAGSGVSFNGTTARIFVTGGNVSAGGQAIFANGILAVASSEISFVNSGTITSAGDGVILSLTNEATSNTFRFSNSGTIEGLEDGAAIGALDVNTRLMNSGTISGVNGCGLAVNRGESVSTHGIITIHNTGTISGGAGSIMGLFNPLVILNAGIISGDAVLSTRADNYNGLNGIFTGTMFGGTGADTLRGGDGHESFDGGGDGDTLLGGGGNDTLMGDSGADLLRGGDGNDEIDGGNDADQIFGNAGDDSLAGGDGIDVMLGGSGDDTLTGGLLRDVLTGGAGADVFDYNTASESPFSAHSDLIRDFEAGTDLIDLTDLNAGVFQFQGSGAFAGGGVASVRVITTASGVSAVMVDVDGNGSTDFRILFASELALGASDFLL